MKEEKKTEHTNIAHFSQKKTLRQNIHVMWSYAIIKTNQTNKKNPGCLKKRPDIV